MAITKNADRQEPIVAHLEIGLADLVGGFLDAQATVHAAELTTATAFGTSIAMPVGAVLVSGNVVVEEAFDSATSDVLDVGDASDDNRYLNDGDLTAVGEIPLVPTGFIHTAAEPAIEITWTKVGAAPTQGRIRLEVTYYVVADVIEKTVAVGYAALTSGAAYDTGLALPVGAVVLDGHIDILTAFNSQTSDVVKVGDATVSDRYVASTDVHTGAATPIPFVPTGFVHTVTQNTLKLTWTKVGTAPSAGSLSITLRYYVLQALPGIDVPANAVVLSGGLTVLEAFDSDTSDAVDVGDSGSATRYKSAGDLQTLGRIVLVPTGYLYTAEDSITVRWKRLAAGLAPTTGSVRLDVKYFVKERAAFTQD